ncbi:divalent cation tolerance protein CutA [Nanohaloarchaea archaeon]|nr:divalent cation tolerance protein CutA [Candidatus Nanohaloarchaea archaeon]
MVYKVRISAGSKDEAKKISDELIEEELVAGTLITSGESRYHWEGEIEHQTYYNIQAYSPGELKQEITKKVESTHSDDVPIIEYIDIEGNQKFLDWVEESVNSE